MHLFIALFLVYAIPTRAAAVETTVPPIELEKKESPSPSALRYGIAASAPGILFPPMAGGQITYKNFDATVSAGFISLHPKAHPDVDIHATILNIELAQRWHPFSGSFYLGMIEGRQKIQVRASTSSKLDEKIELIKTPIDVNADVNLYIYYLTPHVGWNWNLFSHLYIGSELGVRIPLTHFHSIDVASSEPYLDDYLYQTKIYATYADLADRTLKRVGGYMIPHILLLRLTWLF